MSSATLHITPGRGGVWEVKGDNDLGTSAIYPTQTLAIANAVGMLQDLDEAEVIVHGPDGRILTCLSIRHYSANDQDDSTDAELRAEALRITPSNDQLRAMIGKYSLPPSDYDSEELPC